jgi:hypothetical protein
VTGKSDFVVNARALVVAPIDESSLVFLKSAVLELAVEYPAELECTCRAHAVPTCRHGVT